MAEDRPRFDPLLNVKEVADLLDCATSTVWRYVVSGHLPPPIKIGRMTRWRQSELGTAIERATQVR